jgi:transcriptional regulator GlxA family with amidase domain
VKTQSVRTRLLAIQNWAELATAAEYRASRLAHLCGVEPRSLQRFFRTYLGISPQRWLDEARDFEAARLVLNGERTKEIAYRVGYKHASTLCHRFKRARGLSLKEWKRRLSAQSVLGRNVADKQSFAVVCQELPRQIRPRKSVVT